MEGKMRIISLFIKILIIFVLVVFGAFNMQMVEVKYFFNRTPITIPLFILMLILFFSGMILTYLIFMFDRIRLKRELSRSKKDQKETSMELSRLRNLPLFDEEKKVKDEGVRDI
jgi:uncharacterized integral membrane protein